jgi:hypothetical protein
MYVNRFMSYGPCRILFVLWFQGVLVWCCLFHCVCLFVKEINMKLIRFKIHKTISLVGHSHGKCLIFLFCGHSVEVSYLSRNICSDRPLLKYSEQTGYITVEFNWTCNVMNIVQSQVLYKHILNVAVSEICINSYTTAEYNAYLNILKLHMNYHIFCLLHAVKSMFYAVKSMF